METFHYYGLRYATLIFRNVEKPLKIRHVALRQIQAAVEDAGSFTCSDERLNRIWQVARETQRNCLFDAFVDCPTREQAQWWEMPRAGARHELRVRRHHAAGARHPPGSPVANGRRRPARLPAADINLRLPDYMITWVGSLWITTSTPAERSCCASACP